MSFYTVDTKCNNLFYEFETSESGLVLFIHMTNLLPLPLPILGAVDIIQNEST